jgi:hypothetical protein
MSEKGTFVVDRGIFNHPRFAHEPFTEREAWLWLISEAAFKPHHRRIGVNEVALRRGQLAASLRFMGERWQWSEARVRRYLSKLKGTPPKTDALIDALSDAGITVVTILNYDVYQRRPAASDAASDAAYVAEATQQRRKVEETEVKEVGDGGDARAREAIDIANEIARICGLDIRFLPPVWVRKGHGERVKTWLASGWQREIIIATVRATLAKKRDGPPDGITYFEKPIARAHAELAAPVPAASDPPDPQRRLTVITNVENRDGQAHRDGGIIAGRRSPDFLAKRDDFRAAHAELDDYVRRQRGGGNGGQ